MPHFRQNSPYLSRFLSLSKHEKRKEYTYMYYAEYIAPTFKPLLNPLNNKTLSYLERKD